MGKDAIWVVIDQLTMSAHFLPVTTIDMINKLIQLYIREVVRLHGVPKTIASDQDPKFTSHLLGEVSGTRRL